MEITDKLKAGDIVRYVPRHPAFTTPTLEGRLGIVIAISESYATGCGVSVAWPPEEYGGARFFAENLELVGHVEEGG